MPSQTVTWLRGLAARGGKGVVDNIDARCFGRIADQLEYLEAVAYTGPSPDDAYYVLQVHHTAKDVILDEWRKYEFVARGDDDARRMVNAFARVCHPHTCGPLHCIGHRGVRDGVDAVWIERGDEGRIVPMEIAQLKDLPSWPPSRTGPE